MQSKTKHKLCFLLHLVTHSKTKQLKTDFYLDFSDVRFHYKTLHVFGVNVLNNIFEISYFMDG